MIAMAFKGLLGIAVIVALTAYIARPTFPESASNHGLKTVVGLGTKFTNLISDMGSLMGFSSINITRTMLSILTVANTHNANIGIYTATMDGVDVMVFKPVGTSNILRPGIVYYHGGGWVTLSPAMYSMVCQEIALQTQSVVVSVNYRKAPEHVYPIPLEDCLTATRHLLKNAEQYGVDKYNVGVKGDSAGGNLAMAVSLKLSKETDLPPLKFMSLDYPALQAYDFNLPCYRKYDDGPGLLTKKSVIIYWLLYAFGNMTYFDILNDSSHVVKELLDSKYTEYVTPKLLPKHMQDEPSDRVMKNDKVTWSITIPEELSMKVVDPLYAPLMASDDDLKLLPRTYVFNVEFDVLRDDGFILVERMKQLGLDVTHSYLSTEEHGFLNLIAVDPTVADEISRFATFFDKVVDRN